MRRFMVQLDEELLAQLDSVAEAENESRAALVRRAIEGLLAERRRREELQLVVDSFASEFQEDLTVPRRTVREVWPD